MKINAFDLSDETLDVCQNYQNWHSGALTPQMHAVAFRNAISIRDGKDGEIDLRELVIEIDKCWDQEQDPIGKSVLAEAAGECRRLLLRLHAEETAKLAIQGAKDAGVQQWKLQALLSEIYGDSF